MAVKHKKYPKIQGVQFHPESIITDNGVLIIENWVKLINEVWATTARRWFLLYNYVRCMFL